MSLVAEAATDEQPEPPDPDVVEVDPTCRYLRYEEILGTGAFKIVYRAFDEIDGIEVAWSQVRIHDSIMASSEGLERLNREIQLLKSLSHRNIMKFYASWIDGKKKVVNIITELFTSGSLRQYRTKHKKVDMKAVKGWARQILAGLDYLHGQNPAIIHRDLKCDNIFINGNHGEVKIGDFGFATVMQQKKARSIIGTIEYMAPELYGGDYNELVDIYSFGMCMLEMVTCEYPYSECENLGQIYKKVSRGEKPAALSKVKEPEVKSFIEKCLVPAAERLPASELLQNPFLRLDGSNCTKSNILQLQDNINMTSSILAQEPSTCAQHMESDVEAEPIFISVVEHAWQQFQTLVLRKREFLLEGEMNLINPLTLYLRIADQNGVSRKTIEFPLNMDKDTSLSVAIEMVDQLELPKESIPVIAELIDTFLINLISGWKPCINISQIIFEGTQSYIDKSNSLHLINFRQSSVGPFQNDSEALNTSLNAVASNGHSSVFTHSSACSSD